MRLIDADALNDFIENRYEITWTADDYEGGVKDACVDILKYVSAMPSVQPEIIHCRDCKHWREGVAYSYCDKLFGMGVLDVYDYMTEENDFCSMAERRTDEQTD